MPSGLYDADGKIRLTQSPGSGFCGRYAPDGSIYFTTAPGSGFCGSTAPDGSMYIVDATGSTTIGVYAPNGAIRVTTGNEYNGAWRVSGVSSVVASWDASTSTLAQLAAITTHSRTSLATMFDSTGKLTYAPNNLLTQSNTFNNPVWVKASGGTGSAPVVTPNNATGPDGTANAASTVAFNTGAGTSSSDQSILSYTSGAASVGVSYLGAVYVKGSAGAKIQVRQNGAVAYSLFTLTGGWDWLYTKETSTVTTNAVEIGIRQGVNGTINSSITVQIAYATLSAVTYETTPRTGDQVITTSAAYYGPRIDYDPATLAVKGVRIEEASTNVFYPTILSGWSASGTSVGAGSTSVDGASTMMRITEDSATSVHNAAAPSFAFSITSGQTYTISFDSKNYSGSRWVQFSSAGTGIWGNFNPSTGAVGSSGGVWQSAISLATESLGSNGYRCKLTFTSNITTSADVRLYLVTSSSSGAAQNYAGDGTSAIDVSWLQIENKAFDTSRIFTYSAAAARAADVIAFTGAPLSVLRGNVGGAVAEVTSLLNSSPTKSVIGADVLANSSLTFANRTAFTWSSGGVYLSANGFATLTTDRIGVSWSSGGRSFVLNGGSISSDTNTISSANAAYLGSIGGVNYALNGWVKSFAIYNQRLPDATLQARSVVGASYAANDNVNPFAPKFAFANDNLPVHWRIAL